MLFRRNIDGIVVHLRIERYQPPEKHEFGDWWCDCGYSFEFGEILRYSKAEDELLTPEDVHLLHKALSDLLSGKFTKKTEVTFLEPDFEFTLFPKGGDEIGDISAEWRINFWHRGALTANYFAITLDREDIMALDQFLEDCIRRGQ